MECNYNIYEKIEQMENQISCLNSILEELKIEKQKQSDAGWYTINEICLKYSFSRKRFFDYKKLIPLEKAIKLGKYDRYKKVQVHIWIERVKELKKKVPSLFQPDIFER